MIFNLIILIIIRECGVYAREMMLKKIINKGKK